MIAPTDPPGSLKNGLYTCIEGTGRTALCIHGVPGSQRDFRYVAPAVAARGVRAVRVDMPGFGETPIEAWPAHDTRARAALLGRTCAALDDEPVTIVAHSLGCMAAMLAASFYPERVRALVLINTPGIDRHRGIQIPERVTAGLGKLLDVPVLGEALVQAMRSAYRRSGFREADIDAIDATRAKLYTEIVGGLDFHAVRGAVRTLRCPVAIFSSRNDPLIRPRISHNLCDALAEHTRVEHHHFERGGHYLQKHRASEIAAVVERLSAPVKDRAPSARVAAS